MKPSLSKKDGVSTYSLLEICKLRLSDNSRNLPTLKIRQLSNFVPTTLEKLQLPHLAATPFQICQLSNFANSENSSS
ncbi:hypothetical protein CKA32_006166 [Geitlerinema sp. FC II]|nr:hypothetical protein CKA32_006166 [Geitlerinema sp. FC II]